MALARLASVGWAAIACQFLLMGCSGGPAAPDGAGADVRGLTGAPTRVVWVQSDGTDPRAAGTGLILMGLDTEDGRGERVILGERRSYVRPFITPRGNRIVFSSRVVPGPPEIFIVNWDGSGLRTLAHGFALALWEDPADGSEWVYAGSDNTELNFATVTRFPIDAPEKRALVWNASLVGMDSFQVSPDGRLAGGLFPWPHAGVADLQARTVKRLGEGCWPSLASVRGPLYWYFDGSHRNVTMVDVRTDARWMVNISSAPGFEGAEVYHPRWSNHPRFMSISGPYNQGGGNQARTGGPQVEIYLGRFSSDFSKIEAWARATSNSGGDSYPDVWVDGDKSPHTRRPSGRIGPEASQLKAAGGGTAREADPGRLRITARLVRPGPIPTPESILPYRHALVVSEYEIGTVLEGTYGSRSIPIAQWAIRDGRVLEPRPRAGDTHTLTAERFDAHPELEGERLISEPRTSDLPLYYDVGRR